MRLPKTAFFSSSLLLSVDALVAAVLSAVFWLAAARMLPVDVVGTANTFLAAASLISLLSRFGFDFAIPYFFPKMEEPRKLVETSFLVTGIASAVGSLVFIASLPLWLTELSFLIKPAWAATFILLTVSLTWITLFLSLGLARRKVGWVVAQDLIQNGGRIIIWLALLPIGAFGNIEGILVAFAASSVASVLLGCATLFPAGTRPRRVDREVLTLTWPYAIGSHGTSLLASAPNFIIPLMVTALIGPSYTAVFSVVWMVRSAMSILPSSAVSVTFAEGSREPGRLADRFPLLIYLLWGLSAAYGIGFWFLGEWALDLFGDQYGQLGFPLLTLVSLSLPFMVLNDFTVAIQRVFGKLKLVYVVMGAVNLLWLAGSVPGMLLYQLPGLGFAHLASQALVAIIGFIAFRPHPLKRSSLL